MMPLTDTVQPCMETGCLIAKTETYPVCGINRSESCRRDGIRLPNEYDSKHFVSKTCSVYNANHSVLADEVMLDGSNRQAPLLCCYVRPEI